MSIPRLYNTEAIVLRKLELGEADSILTLYTPHQGKIKAVAKGIRKAKSKIGGHAELLVHSQMLLARAKSLDTITQSQTIDSFIGLRNDLWATSSALYVAELVDRFTEESEESQPVFRLLLETLRRLCNARHKELALRYFEVHLFRLLGYQPELHQCVACHTSLRPSSCYFTPDGGGVLCSNCRHRNLVVCPLSLNALKVFRFIQAQPFAEVDRLKVGPSLAGELKQVMRRYIRYLLERELKCAGWLDRLERESPVSG